MTTGRIEWEWDDAATEGTATSKNYHFTLTFREDGKTVEVRCTDREDKSRWSQRISTQATDRAALVAAPEKLFVALYSYGLTGCTVFALDGLTGKVLWETSLEGLGSIGHSRYANRVQMQLRDGDLVIFGNEASGKYIEVLDADDGRRILYRKV